MISGIYSNVSIYLKQRKCYLWVGYHEEYPNKIENGLRYGYKHELVVEKEAYGINTDVGAYFLLSALPSKCHKENAAG